MYPASKLRIRRAELFLGALGIGLSIAGQVSDLYVNDYPALDVPIAGAKELVASLGSRFTLGIISNGLPDVQYQKLDAVGTRSHFSCIVLSEEFGIAKPDPRIFHHALSLVSILPDEAVYVGDSFENDVVGALDAGMQACWYNPQGNSSTRPDVHPTHEVSELSMVGAVLGFYAN